jgi:hypothetical protein
VGDPGGELLVVCAPDFTVEAAELLKERRAVLVSIRAWGWTDASWASVRGLPGR